MIHMCPFCEEDRVYCTCNVEPPIRRGTQMKIASITCSCGAVLTPLLEGQPVNGAECQNCGMFYIILRRADGDLELRVNDSQKEAERPFRKENLKEAP